MILLTYRSKTGLKLGVKVNGGILDANAAALALLHDNDFSDVNAFIKEGLAILPSLRTLIAAVGHHTEWLLTEDSITFGPCVPQPGKIVCVGLNYRRHAEESGMTIPTTPVLFSKFNNAVAAHGEGVPISSELEKVDYEAELGVVIGKRGKHIAQADALDHVLGYCNINDISERALQMLTGQWLLGKTPDAFLPMGPYLLTKDEVPDPQNLAIRCWLNDDLRQDSNTSDMIFPVAEIISYASRYMTLEAGDVISTGTPAGVILGMNPRVWMKVGDKMVVEVGDGQFGQLHNTLVAE